MARKYNSLNVLSHDIMEGDYYGRGLSHVCGYMRALDLTRVRKELFLGAFESASKPPCGFWRIDDQQLDI
jgi:hypothetical protein